MAQFGCVVFEDPHKHEEGWAAKAEEEAKRVRGTMDLATNTTWMTNLGYDLMQRAGLNNHVRFRRMDYLRETLPQVAARHKIETAWELAAHGAAIFNRTMHLTQKILRMQHTPKFALRNGIREIISAKDPVFPLDTHQAITEAISYKTTCERYAARRGEEEIRHFKIPQRQHARAILQTPLPKGEFRQLTKLPRGNDDILDWLTGLGKPALIRATACHFEDAFNKLINFGDSPAGPNSERRWVTNQELLYLATFAEVQVHEALVATDSMLFGHLLDILDKLPAAADSSLSCCLFLENLWTAVGTSYVDRTAETAETLSINPYTPFTRAMDRIGCFQYASKLTSSGFEVVGYATGSIWVNCTDRTDSEIVSAALTAGLIPPMCSLKPSEFPQVDMSDPLRVMQMLYGCGMLKELVVFDRKIIEEKILEGSLA